jgi:hypothetical protein
MHEPIMTRLDDMQKSLQNDLSALNDRFSELSTSEQYQQISDHQTQLESNFNTLNTAFGDFRDHFYHYYPAPAPPPQFCPPAIVSSSSAASGLLDLLVFDAKGGEIWRSDV